RPGLQALRGGVRGRRLVDRLRDRRLCETRRHLDVFPRARLRARAAAGAELFADEHLPARIAPDGAGRAVGHARGVLAVLAAVREEERTRRLAGSVLDDDLVAAPDEARDAVAVRVGAAPGAMA